MKMNLISITVEKSMNDWTKSYSSLELLVLLKSDLTLSIDPDEPFPMDLTGSYEAIDALKERLEHLEMEVYQ